MKLRHKDKMRLAKKMISPMEFKKGISIFASKQWVKRSMAIKLRLSK